MNDDGVRLWWLVRQNGPHASYVLTAYVTTERDEESNEPVFESTIKGLEDRLAATGETAYEAEYRAMELLDDMLKDAMDSESVDECFEGAKGLGIKSAKVPIDQMAAMLEEFVKTTTEEIDWRPVRFAGKTDGWMAKPATAEVAVTC